MKDKMKTLQIDGLQELSPSDTSAISGGGLDISWGRWFAGGVATAFAFVGKMVADDWQCFKDGLAGNRSSHGVTHGKF